MTGLKTLLVDKQLVIAAIQDYLDKSITPNVIVSSIAPVSPQYGPNQTVVVPDSFQITVEPKEIIVP